MNRRIFLKLLGFSPVVPSVLMAKEKLPFKPNNAQMSIIAKDTKCGKFPEPTYSCNGIRHTSSAREEGLTLAKLREAKMQKVSQDIYGSPDMLEMRQPMRVFMSNSELEHFIKCHRFPDDMKFGDMIYGSILTEY